MWFKNIRFYTVNLDEIQDVFKDEVLLDEAIQKARFKPIPAQEVASIGFVPLYGEDTPYHFCQGENYFFKLVEESKLLPASVIKNEASKEIRKKELEAKRQLKKSEKEAIMLGVKNMLLARAFTTRREMMVWVNLPKKLLGISVTSAKRAEKAIALLREAFSTFPAKLITPRCKVDDRMTLWLKENNLPQRFELGSEITLKSLDEDGGIIRASKEDLTSKEIFVHLDAGKVVTNIALTFDDSIFFDLAYDLSLKRIKATDIYLENNLPKMGDDEIADMNSTLVLQGEYFTQILEYLLEIFDCDRD